MEVVTKVLNGKSIPWISESDYNKSVGQFKLQLNGIFEPFNVYGLDVFIPGAKEAIIKLAEDFALRTRGIDKGISLQAVRNKTNFRVT